MSQFLDIIKKNNTTVLPSIAQYDYFAEKVSAVDDSFTELGDKLTVLEDQLKTFDLNKEEICHVLYTFVHEIVNNPTWKWFDGKEWIRCNIVDSAKIEKEYQQHLAGTRKGQLVFHCFGDKTTALIDYSNMRTTCGSGWCMGMHEFCGVSDDHMTYPLLRE